MLHHYTLWLARSFGVVLLLATILFAWLRSR